VNERTSSKLTFISVARNHIDVKVAGTRVIRLMALIAYGIRSMFERNLVEDSVGQSLMFFAVIGRRDVVLLWHWFDWVISHMWNWQ